MRWGGELDDFCRVLLSSRWLQIGESEILILTLRETNKAKGKAQCICVGAAWSGDDL